MLGINGIQSPILPVSRPQASPDGGVGQSGGERNPGPVVDTYGGGSEAWQNRAQTSVGETACRCGNCPSCAAKAYGAQDQQLGGSPQAGTGEQGAIGDGDAVKKDDKPATSSESRAENGETLSQQEKAEIAELKKIDRAVRAHEQAHMSAAGSLVQKGVSLSYEKGPDGRRYAVGGEVSIDTSKEAAPSDTIAKMQTVRAAALAPADPSPQDRKVAAAATAAMTKARGELRLEKVAEENAEGVVEQAAEKMAAGKSKEANAHHESPNGLGSGDSEKFSPQRNNILQRYSPADTAQAPRLAAIA